MTIFVQSDRKVFLLHRRHPQLRLPLEENHVESLAARALCAPYDGIG